MKSQVKFYYVYIITNTVLNKQYVGSRMCYKDNIEDDNYWGSSKYLNEDYKIYGKENFIKEILKKDCKNKKKLLDVETEYILKYNTLESNGYNRFLPNKNYGFHCAGKKASQETREKLSKSHKDSSAWSRGKKLSEKHKNNIGKGNKGKIRTLEMNELNRQRNLGINNPNFGLKRSPETRQKQREAQLGEKNHMYGKHRSEETKKKIHETFKLKRENKFKQEMEGIQATQMSLIQF
jgi:hypothetical protein